MGHLCCSTSITKQNGPTLRLHSQADPNHEELLKGPLMADQQSTQDALGAIHPFPAIKPGHRLVPARIETSTSSIVIHLECPFWCTEDHLDEPVRAVEDVMHRGDTASVHVPTFGYGAYPVQMHAWVESDPVAADPQFRAAHIAIGDASGDEGSHLTPDMADKLADDLITLASSLRSLARTARLHNAAGDSEPDMDEALRRIRGGVA
jgi:hypothetical protein